MLNLLKILCIISIIMADSISHALECYVCTNQEDNSDKCLKSLKICEQGEDVCLTEIKWGSTPYWSQGAKKQFYISKRCSSKVECERVRRNNMPLCTHIWYQDWKCSECCHGDRCNYYIISDASQIKATFGSIILVFLSIFLLAR